VRLNYRSDHVARSLALELAGILESAILFLLESGPEPGSEPLCDAFFLKQSGKSRIEVESFWAAGLKGLEATHFPSPPHPSFVPKLDATTELSMHSASGIENDKQMTILLWTAWALVVARYTNTDDVIFGTVLPVANQGRRSQSHPGSIVSTTPVRISVNHELEVAQMLEASAILHDQVAQFGRVSRHWIRQMGAEFEEACAFQSLIHAYETNGSDRESQLAPLLLDHDVALQVVCQMREHGLRLALHFDSSVLARAQADRMMRQLEGVISQLLRADLQRSKMDVIQTMSEQDLIDAWTWNAVVPEDVDVCVHDIFAESARRRPDAPAICAWDGELTYQELDTLSTTLAVYLVSRGIRPNAGIIIPICIEKSVWTPVAQLAVMKAGAASVLLDSSHPEVRLQTVVEQVFASLDREQCFILSSKTNRRLSEKLVKRSSPEANLIMTEAVATQQSSYPGGFSLPRVKPDDLLYVVFTSGSTGVPKGAMISHRNFGSAIRHQKSPSGFTEASRVFDFVSYAFDVTWRNFLHTIAAGGCLCIPNQARRQDDLADSLRALRANYVHLTPTVGRLINCKDVPAVRTFVLGGEKLTRNDVEHYAGVDTVQHTYGPAECTVTVMGSTIQPDGNRQPSIGKGWGSVNWIVGLDGSALAAIGQVGELWIEGPLVGQGYLGNPEKTAEVFIEDPLWLVRGAPSSNIPGRRGRLYRTGDLVRYSSDGSISFVGRKDDQVKIRGQRVELGDVETHVKQLISVRQPDIQLTAEIIEPRGSPNPVLVVFISLPGKSHDLHALATELTRGLNEQLALHVPRHMIPSAYIPLETIPTTLTGKVDRKQLRLLGRSIDLVGFNESLAVRKAPSSDLQSILVDIWAEVLGISADRISVDSPFTSLGGDSITAMQVISRLRALQIQATVGDVLRQRTIELIAPKCKLLMITAAPEVEAENEAWGLSPIQRLFFSRHPDGLNHFNQSFMLQPQVPYKADDFRKIVEPLVSRHRMLRARFHKDSSGSWQQRIAPMNQTAFSFSAYEGLSPAEIGRVTQSRQESLDIVNGPVFAIDYFKSDGIMSVLFTAHHLVIDLVSWRIVWHDAEQLLKGVALPPVTGTSFRKWTAVQDQLGQETDVDALLPFELVHRSWGVMPAENVASAVIDYHTQLDAHSTSLLLGACTKGLRAEPTHIMVAVLIHSLHQALPDRAAPAIFVEGHGREPLNDASLDLAETVGWFTSLCPVQISLRPNSDIVEAVKRVKDIRHQITGKGLPFFASRHRHGLDYGSEGSVAEFLFNYAGVFQQLDGRDAFFRRVDANIVDTSPNSRRTALVEVNGIVEDGKLRLQISVHRRMDQIHLLERWGTGLADKFRDAIECLARLDDTPTLSDFPLLQPSLSYDSLDSIMAQLSRRGHPAESIAHILPCTPLQEGILLGIAKGSASYHIVQVWKCTSATPSQQVDVERLRAAWRLTIESHSIFSTIFLESAELGSFIQVELKHTPAQIVEAQTSRGCPITTLTSLDKLVFLDHQPPYTVTICQGANGEIACRLDISHVLMDATSCGILLEDVAKAYDQGHAAPAAPAAPAFSAAIEEITRVCPDRKLQYWRGYLAGTQPCNIPALNCLGSETLHAGIPLSSQVTDRIDAFCRSMGVTRATFLQVSWGMVLSQLTGMDEVCFGYLASGRDIPVPGVERTVGPFINALISRIDLRSHASEVLIETGKHLVNHFDFQHVSLAKIQGELGLQSQKLFNTGLTVRQSLSMCQDAQSLHFEDAFWEDPNEVNKAHSPCMIVMQSYTNTTGVHSSISPLLPSSVNLLPMSSWFIVLRASVQISQTMLPIYTNSLSSFCLRQARRFQTGPCMTASSGTGPGLTEVKLSQSGEVVSEE
jgi:amino acid adenylation domain-containing protein